MSQSAPAPVRPRLIAITDSSVADDATLCARAARLCALARPGSVMVLLRQPEWTSRARLELGRALRRLTRAAGQLLSVADRADLAELLDADGLHLGEASIEVDDARSAWGTRFLSRAWHDAARPVEVDVDAVLLSPIFEPRKGSPALGVEALAEFCRRSPGVSTYALGGVDAARAAQAIAAGAAGVAAIGAALGSGDASALVAALGVCR